MVVDDAPAPEAYAGGVLGGVPGGVPGGVIGGVLGGVLGGAPAPSMAPPPPPPPKVEAPKVIAVPVRVGGSVRSLSPRLVKRVEPEYPLLAKASRIKGSVRWRPYSPRRERLRISSWCLVIHSWSNLL